MSIQPLLAHTQQSSLKKEIPDFEIGDTVDVHVRILEGEKERIQLFTGIVIARRGAGSSENFVVRRIVDGEGVERIFPVHSPKIADVVVTRRAVVRRAKLYYLRDRVGKQAFRLKERQVATEKKTAGRARTRIKARKAAAATAAAAPAEEKKAKKPKTKKAAKPKAEKE